MEVVHFIYGEQEIDFLPTANDNVMVNATQMAKIFGKEVKHFNENDSTEKFINACLKSRNSDFLGIKKKEDLIDSKQKSGTWMHRILALKFAAWLDPDFEVWVYTTIDKLLFENYRIQREAMIEKIKIADRKRQLENELIDENPKLKEYFDLIRKEREAASKSSKAIKDQFKQLQIEFVTSN